MPIKHQQQQQQTQLSPGNLSMAENMQLYLDAERHSPNHSAVGDMRNGTMGMESSAISPAAGSVRLATSPSISISSNIDGSVGIGAHGNGIAHNTTESLSPSSTASSTCSTRYRRNNSNNGNNSSSNNNNNGNSTNNTSNNNNNMPFGNKANNHGNRSSNNNNFTLDNIMNNGANNTGAGGMADAGFIGNNAAAAAAAAYGNNGQQNMDLRPLDHCLNDIMRNISVVGSSNENMAMAAALVERLRNQKLNEQQQQQQQQAQHNDVDAAAAVYLDTALNLKLNSSPARNSVVGSSANTSAVSTASASGAPGSGPGPGPGPGAGATASAVNLSIVGGSGVVEHTARYSRKVFVGGLPPDIDEDEITSSFRRFGPLVVDWPHKAESKSYFPPKGYAFLLFQDENSVQQLIDACITDDDKLYLCVSSPTIKDKPVQIRPWRLADADYVLDATMSLDPRKTVFVGGVPRPLKAFELAMIMDRLYGGVCYAGIDTDPELKYPKGAGRVAFANQQSYIAAISARFVQLQHGDIDKRVEVKPYVLDDQMCDECEGQRCSGKFAPFFCANVTCLQYYCEHCWAVIHSRPGREYHKPLVKEGADRPRAVPFRWC